MVTKQVHLGETSFVSGYATRILKPATPHLPISVPTVLKGSVAYNAPIVKEQIEVHQVQNPGLVERRVEVPYDVPVYQENIVKVPTPVHVDAPYNVHVPTPVAGEPIIKRTLLPYTHAVVPVEAPRLAVSNVTPVYFWRSVCRSSACLQESGGQGAPLSGRISSEK